MTSRPEPKEGERLRPSRKAGQPFRNAGKLGLGRSVNVVCSLAYLACATRALGVEDFGRLVLIHTFCQVAALLLRFESWQAIVRFGTAPLHNDDPEELRKVLNFGVSLDFVGMALGMALYGVLLFPLGSAMGLPAPTLSLALPYGLAVIAFLNLSGSATGALQLGNHFGSLARAVAVEPLLRLTGALLVWWIGGGLGGFLLVWLLALGGTHGAIVYAAFARLAERGEAWRFRVNFRAWVHPETGWWNYALGTFWIGTTNVVRDALPTLATGLLVGPAGAGLLKVARQFAEVLSGITNKLFIPALFAEFAALESGARLTLLVRLTFLAIALYAVVFGVFLFAGESLILLVAGPPFRDAYPVMLWLAFAGLVGATSLGVETMFTSVGEIRRVVLANTLSLSFFVPATLLLLPELGILGVGIAATAQAIIRSVSLWWRFRVPASHPVSTTP